MNKCKKDQLKGGEKEMKDDVSRNFQSEEQELTYKKGGNNMKTKMKKLIKNQKGMTLIELLAVLVIIAIVALIAIPAIGNIINNSHDKAIISSASNILNGAKIAKSDGACEFNATKPCDKTNIDDYVEGAEGSYSVTYDSTKKEYTITYEKLADIKSDKYKDFKDATNKQITSTKLKEALNK